MYKQFYREKPFLINYFKKKNTTKWYNIQIGFGTGLSIKFSHLKKFDLFNFDINLFKECCHFLFNLTLLNLIDISFSSTRRTSHFGITLDINILWFHTLLQIYDGRHYDRDEEVYY